MKNRGTENTYSLNKSKNKIKWGESTQDIS